MKVRIGNDIALNIHLSQKYVKDPINIKNVQCIVVPCNGMVDTPFTPSKYDINRCGLPVYHMLPCCDGIRPCCETSYSMQPYNGFGVNIQKNDTYCVDPCCCGSNACKLAVRSLGAPDSFMAFFPAYDQHILGKYTLVVIAELYEPGYDYSNLRTVTVDYSDVFELVASSEEADAQTSVAIQVGNGSDPTITDICISPASITDVIAGNLGMIVATVCPSTNSNQNFLWQFDDTHINVFDDKGSTLVFKANNIPVTSTGTYSTEITVYAADNVDVYKKVPVTIYNCMDHIDVATPIDASKLTSVEAGQSITITPLYQEIAFGEDMVLVPTVVLQNGDKITYYQSDSGSLEYAVDARVVKGQEYIIATYYDQLADVDQYMIKLIDGTIRITNNNTTKSVQTVQLCITSNIQDVNGDRKSFYYTARLAPKS